jgi:hypothetical protein
MRGFGFRVISDWSVGLQRALIVTRKSIEPRELLGKQLRQYCSLTLIARRCKLPAQPFDALSANPFLHGLSRARRLGNRRDSKARSSVVAAIKPWRDILQGDRRSSV